LATLRTTKISPGWLSKITSGATRESQQPISMTSGRWPAAASRSKRLRSSGRRVSMKAR
jgi:hypothetical protein